MDRIPLGNFYCDPCFTLMAELNLDDANELDPIENLDLREYLMDADFLE